jgi:hypothetical protein
MARLGLTEAGPGAPDAISVEPPQHRSPSPDASGMYERWAGMHLRNVPARQCLSLTYFTVQN